MNNVEKGLICTSQTSCLCLKRTVSFSTAGYSPELENVLHRFVLSNCQADEFALCEQFDKPDHNKRWREGFIKSCFNYLLLDPRYMVSLTFYLCLLLFTNIFTAALQRDQESTVSKPVHES